MQLSRRSSAIDLTLAPELGASLLRRLDVPWGSGMAVQLRLRRFPYIHTRSLEEGEHIHASINSPIRSELAERRVPFEWQANATRLGGLAIVASAYRAAVRGQTAEVRSYSLVIPGRSGGFSRHGAQSSTLAPKRTAAISSPGAPGSFELGSRYRGLQLSIPTAMVSSAMRALTGEEPRALPRFGHALDLRAPDAASVIRLLNFLVDELDDETSMLAIPRFAQEQADAFVCAMVACLPHDQQQLLRRRTAAIGPSALRRVEEYVAAHPNERMTLADLAAVAGTSGRAVQVAFRRHRGCTPMEFVRDRRYALARQLLAEKPTATITSIALECGFENLGRFTEGYRKRFGETPRQTRR